MPSPDLTLPPHLEKWDALFREKAMVLYPASDPSHDYLHIRRVVTAALRLAAKEGADINIVVPAAYFHDFVNVRKDDPRRKEASRLSAEAAVAYLAGIGYPAQYLDGIAHAIAAHSFSAGIPADTIEAKVVQDADRLDSLGAIGIARCFSTSTIMGRPYYKEGDVLAETRAPDDKAYAVDHFFIKLFKLVDMLQTPAAREEGHRRAKVMQQYLEQLKAEAA